MIARIREKVADLQLLLDIPARMVALEQENADALGQNIDLARRLATLEEYVTDMDGHVADLDAMTREFYGVRPIEAEVRRDA